MPPRAAYRRILFLCAVLAAGCSQVPYSARPLDAESAAAEYAQRSGSSEGLKRFALANGYADAAWPPQQWGLRELALAALYFHPDMDVARSRAAVAHARFASSSLRPAPGLRVKPEYHGRELEEDNGPWTLGLELEIPLVAQGKRESQFERNAFLADAADIDVAAAAWQVRARVRDRLAALQEAREALASIGEQVAARRETLGLIERRVQAGMLSAHELGAERLALAQLELAGGQQAGRADAALAELAQAVGLPLDVAAMMTLRFATDLPADIDAEPGRLRRLALRNRLDVHRKLLEFGAADADLKFAVAAQNPDIVLGPGYTWDQGDNVWSLAVGFSMPSAAHAQAAIREAEAQRELAAQQFYATQAGAVAAAEGAAAQYRLARERVAAAARQLDAQRQQQARIERQFDAGAADRLQRVGAQVEALLADDVLRAAQAQARQALARVEDAVQRPLFGDFDALPDMRSATLSTSAQP